MARIFVGIPTYKSDMNVGLLFPLLQASRKHHLDFANSDTSATCFSFNKLWIDALELWEAGKITHFLMVHSDIIPERYFVDKMMAIMERCGADVLSAIVPIKSNEGLTSTAMEEPWGDEDPRWRVRRVTMREAHALPKTWTHDAVLLNTGLMLVKMGEWCKQMHFHFDDAIIMYRGRRIPACFPEDWNFSRDAKKLGAKLYASREVSCTHVGNTGFPNFNPWGTLERDFMNPEVDPIVDPAVDAARKVDGYMSENELRWLAHQAKNAEVIVEVGSWKGRSTKALAMATKGVVYAVDNWRGNGGDDLTGVEARERGADAIKKEFRANLAAEIASGKVVIVDVDHAEAAPLLRSLMMDGPGADLVFIDGDHTKAAVKRDIQNFRPFVRPGGKLSGHDYSPLEPGVVDAIKEAFDEEATVEVGTIWSFDVSPLHLVKDEPGEHNLVPGKVTYLPESDKTGIRPAHEKPPITSSALEERSTTDQK